MLSRDIANLVPLVSDGGSRRFPHPCGEGKPLQISREGASIRAWCHRCAEGVSYRLEESFQEKLARLQAQEAQDRCLGQGLPHPPIYSPAEWPPGALLWLLKAGFGEREIRERGIFYHRESDRVVIPYPRQGFWIARAHQTGRTPKYLSPTPKPRDLCVAFGQGDKLVLTEDILSAMKVGRVTESWALMGVRLSQHCLTQILDNNREVVVWLDPDPPGQAGAHAIVRQLRAFGVPVRNLVSERDPKLYSTAQIKELLQ
ncbi:putative DnaG-like primase [uncultured Caudovirales phage]|uniref:Putative DnaG-like primase n=1 Tax=uncultured Caudovirales phage TaxID=2100421 RepID=A0A6J5TAY5_9CAUD|nr:putative DnaG-like primase [uncultured Caudovirales phage]